MKKKDKKTNQIITETKNLQSSPSFFSFLSEKEQKIDLLVLGVCFLIIFVVMRITYPYPVSVSDSGSYILSAKTMVINGYRPIGYSWFIKFFHGFSESVVALFAGQFLLNAFAQLLFIFSVKYFFSLKRPLLYLFSALFILSPSIIFCTNYIMSDSIFNSLTLLYLATAFWIIKKPNALNIILHFVILYLLINVRYAALFYPILSSGILLLHVKKKLLYALVALIPIIIIVKIYKDTKAETKKVYNIDEFSGFSGWAAANNVASILPYIELQPSDIKDKQSQIIHQIVTSYPDSLYQKKYIDATSFIWRKNFPGKHVLFYNIQNEKYSYIKGWIHTGRDFKKYASSLVKRYPVEYFKYYLFPNFKNLFDFYVIPKARKYTPDDLSKEYFQLEIDSYEYEYDFLHKTDTLRRFFVPILWLSFLISLFMLFYKKIIFQNVNTKLIVFVLVFFLAYAGFSVIAHPINNFRYLMPIYCILLLIPFIVLDKMLNKRNV